MPVLSLDRFRFRFLSFFDIPVTGGSPNLPPGVVFLPQKITPFKNVPVVRTMDLALIVSPPLH